MAGRHARCRPGHACCTAARSESPLHPTPAPPRTCIQQARGQEHVERGPRVLLPQARTLAHGHQQHRWRRQRAAGRRAAGAGAVWVPCAAAGLASRQRQQAGHGQPTKRCSPAVLQRSAAQHGTRTGWRGTARRGPAAQGRCPCQPACRARSAASRRTPARQTRAPAAASCTACAPPPRAAPACRARRAGGALRQAGRRAGAQTAVAHSHAGGCPAAGARRLSGSLGRPRPHKSSQRASIQAGRAQRVAGDDVCCAHSQERQQLRWREGATGKGGAGDAWEGAQRSWSPWQGMQRWPSLCAERPHARSQTLNPQWIHAAVRAPPWHPPGTPQHLEGKREERGVGAQRRQLQRVHAAHTGRINEAHQRVCKRA